MDYSEIPKSDISQSLKILRDHEKLYLGGVNGGILAEHFVSLKHGLEFLETFLEFSGNHNMRGRIRDLVSYVKKKLYYLTCPGKDENPVMYLDFSYSVLREKMTDIFEHDECEVIFPEIFTDGYDFSATSYVLGEKIKKLMTLECKSEQITPMMKELEDIRKMLTSLLEPLLIYAKAVRRPFTVKEEVKDIFTVLTTVLDRVACFIYLAFVGKLDEEMVISLKSSLSDLVIDETQIMNMCLILDIDLTGNLEPPIFMLLRRMKWVKRYYLTIEMGPALEDHFVSIKQGLKFLVKIPKISKNLHLELHIQHLLALAKQKLAPLSCEDDDDQVLNLKHALGELREDLENVVFNRGTDEYHRLLPENQNLRLNRCFFSTTKDFLLEKIQKLVTSSSKAAHIAPIMKELEDLRKKLTSLNPLFDSLLKMFDLYVVMENEKGTLAALTSFLGRATCLVYLSLVGKLDEDMLVSLRKNLASLIVETEINEKSLRLGINYEDEFEYDMDISLLLLKRHERYTIGSINEAICLKDLIISLKHGIEFLRWLPKFYFDGHLKRRIRLLAGKVKQKLESLTYEQDDENIYVSLEHAYADLREEMKNFTINPETTKEYNNTSDFRVVEDFLLEKITKLVTSDYMADQVAPLKKELQDFRKMVTSFKPLGGHLRPDALLTSNICDVTCLLYYCFLGNMDTEMVLFVKSKIETAVEETDVLQMYLNVVVSRIKMTPCVEEELCLLENLIFLLKENIEAFNYASSKLCEVLTDIHNFLLGLPRNVLFKRLHLLQTSFQAILGHSIAIICSCYIEDNEVDISAELNCVCNLTEHIKSQEIGLYYFPRVDDLGFLKGFSRYLKDLMGNQKISMEEEIDALHFEVHSLLSRVTNERELDETPWTAIINMAYQAEYIIDHILVRSCNEFGSISSLSKIIEQLKNIRADVHDHSYNSLPAQDVEVTNRPKVLCTTTQVGDNDAIVGLQVEISIISEYLLKGENNLDIISITGIGGVGKTTLASTLYNSPAMADRFDTLAWCTVSQSYKCRDLLLSILDQVNAFDKNHTSILDDQELADHLSRSLKKRRYFIVIDDIWDTTLWNYLKRYLPDDMKGSRVLITTRNKDVALQIGSKVNELHGLCEENSWELFQKTIHGEEILSDHLLKISKGILEHCKGLPLSIVIIAGILSDIERTEAKWNQIAESVNSLVLSDPQGNCKAILGLSYDQLPNHLRSCFLYLGSFPEDLEIPMKRLTILWIAEGLVQDTKSDSAEEVAKRYMEDLVAKSLVIPVKERSRGGVKTLRLHDLLREFCLDKAKEKHFFTLVDKRNYSQPLQDPYRLIIYGLFNITLKFCCHNIRTLISFDDWKASEIEKGIVSFDMVLLKVLEVGVWSYASSFPNISSLVHLRYLAMGFMNPEASFLPSSIRKLHNLQILILRGKFVVIKVPDVIWDMVKLRHVDISPEASFQVHRNRLRESSTLLENLKSLSKARLSCGDSNWLTKLSGLRRLHCVFLDWEDNRCPMLSFSHHLTSLKVENEAGLVRFMGRCQLPTGLRKLTLSKWYFRSNDISEIGRALPLLEVFKIHTCLIRTGCQWAVDDEDFPELKVLKVKGLKISKWTVSENSFPKLEQLWMEKCDYLDEIPLDFGYLLKLRYISVRECAPSVDASARKIEKMQHEEQNTEMKVHIYPRKL